MSFYVLNNLKLYFQHINYSMLLFSKEHNITSHLTIEEIELKYIQILVLYSLKGKSFMLLRLYDTKQL